MMENEEKSHFQQEMRIRADGDVNPFFLWRERYTLDFMKRHLIFLVSFSIRTWDSLSRVTRWYILPSGPLFSACICLSAFFQLMVSIDTPANFSSGCFSILLIMQPDWERRFWKWNPRHHPKRWKERHGHISLFKNARDVHSRRLKRERFFWECSCMVSLYDVSNNLHAFGTNIKDQSRNWRNNSLWLSLHFSLPLSDSHS